MLYDRAVLRLAARSGDWPLWPDAFGQVTRRSPTCGSVITMALIVADDRVERIGMATQLCAVGQAAATLFADGAIGADASRVANVAAAVRLWLVERDAPLPWPGLCALAAVRDYPARHAALCLPFDAAAAIVAPWQAAA